MITSENINQKYEKGIFGFLFAWIRSGWRPSQNDENDTSAE